MWPFTTSSKYPIVSIQQAGSLQAQDSPTPSYDYIIIGGGTAGCCLASRLSEDPSVSVLVLERGIVHDTWFSRIPLISSDVTSKATPIVRSSSLPLDRANGQIVDIVHAETLGGGSGVNSMLVTRGAVGDFDHWAEMGHRSWSYEALKPYFVKSETTLSHKYSTDRGFSGPLVNQISLDLPFAVLRHVKEAALALNFAEVHNLNSSDTPVNVCATLDMAIDNKMRRVSSYHAYLPLEVAQLRSKHLKICTRAVATRIIISSGIAIGVEFESSDKSVPGTFYARAEKEIVVCCGALGSPQLLLLSGIGSQETLKNVGIDTVCDLPGVGQHLQDHVGVPLMYEVPLKDTLHHIENSIFQGIWELGRYIFTQKGIMSRSVNPISIFAHSMHLDDQTSAVVTSTSTHEGTNRPDLEIMPIAHWCSDPPPFQITKGVFSFLLCAVQPRSFGSVQLASRDPHARPVVELGFLTDSRDFAPLRKGVKLCLRLAERMSTVEGYEMKGFQVPVSEKESDLDDFIRAHLRTAYHYVSSCRMAPREEGGVVDDELKVYGICGLRVCDASVFPRITSGHTMAPVIAVAERCADLIK